jgi:hypothetical protein
MVNTGLDIDKQSLEQIQPDKHLMGGFGMIQYPDLITKDPYWMPTVEQCTPECQFGAKLETMNCTNFGTNYILRLIWKFQYGLDINISERGTGVMSGTTRQGNSVDAPIDALRKYGFLLENELPFDRDGMSWDDYYAPLSQEQYALAKTRLNDWDFAHEYVPVNPQAMMQALKTSPLGGTVAAWYKDSNGLYRTMGHTINHWTTVIVGFKYGEYWLCVDSYPEDYNYADNPQSFEFVKKLAWDYNFGCIKRYKIVDKRSDKKKKTPFSLILKNMQEHLWSYSDAKGVYFFFVKKIDGVLHKQQLDISKLPPELALLKALFILFGETDGATRKTSYGEISKIPDNKFF